MDESEQKGPFYSNFYGGALVRSNDWEEIASALEAKKKELHLFREVKWQRVTPQYLNKYLELMDTFFDFVEKDLIKVRIMFTHNYDRPQALTAAQRDAAYQILYYHFFKHAFGLMHSNPEPNIPLHLRVYLDELPISKVDAERLKDFIFNLTSSTDFQMANIRLRRDAVTEVCSDDHVILQCVDIVLGAMFFRLNDLHKQKPPGSYRRGKRTVAKEKLYKHINARLRAIYPNFNIGESTGIQGDYSNRWVHPYRHWKFVASNSEIAPEFAKRKK